MNNLDTVHHIVEHARRFGIPRDFETLMILAQGKPRIFLHKDHLGLFLSWARSLHGAQVVAEGKKLLTCAGKLQTGEPIEVLIPAMFVLPDGTWEIGEVEQAAKPQLAAVSA